MKLRKIISFAALSLLIFNINTIKSFADSNKYETYKKGSQKQVKFSNDEYIPEEVKLDLLEEANMDYLKKKTSKKYEIAMADSNGDYTYVKAFNSLDDAINEVKNIKNKKSNTSEVPVIINEDGIVVYATQSIGRLTRLVDGKASTDRRFNVNIYSTSTSKNALTYANHGYMDDMPIIAQTATRVKVEVNGVIGWIDKQETQVVDGKTKTVTNVVQVPLNQANNLSYYKRSGNDLIHYISSNVAGGGGYSVVIGKAPSFMNDGSKYYSYDGNYFYDSIEKLVVDAENGNHNNAVNSQNIFYNYYLYLPGRTKTSYTAKDLNKYLNSSTSEKSILRNKGYEFIQAQNKYGVNASFMIGIAMNESGKGTSSIAMNKNNIFGLNAVDASPGQSANYFKSVGDCVNEFASHWMSKGYFNISDWRYSGACLGNKGLGVNVRYASDPYWGEKACSYMYDMDKTISGSNELIDYNKYQIALYSKANTVKNSSGDTLYEIFNNREYKKSGQIGDPLVILSQTSNGYEIYPDRQHSIYSDTKITGEYDWSVNGYVSTSGITKINEKNTNTRPESNEHPVISASNKSIKLGSTFNPKSSVKATDKEDGDLTSKVTINGSVDTNKPGVYTIKYTITDSDGNKVSKNINITVLNKFSTFTVNSVKKSSTTISGKGLKGATVKAYINGKQIGKSVTVNSKGTYSIGISKQKAGTEIVVKMSKSGYSTIQKTIKVLNEFSTFTVNSVKKSSTTISGKGLKGATVKAYINGKQIGKSVTVNSKGTYSIGISKQKAGTEIVVKMSKSGYSTIQKTIKVLNEFSTFTVNSVKKSSTTISGKGLKGATVKAYINGKQIGKSATVNSKGTYSISIAKQKIGTKIVVKMSKSGYATIQKTITVK